MLECLMTREVMIESRRTFPFRFELRRRVRASGVKSWKIRDREVKNSEVFSCSSRSEEDMNSLMTESCPGEPVIGFDVCKCVNIISRENLNRDRLLVVIILL